MDYQLQKHAELALVSKQFGYDIDADRLKAHLQSLENFPRSAASDKSADIGDLLSIIGKIE